MRIEFWNPNIMDETFENVAIERLAEAAEVVRNHAKQKCPIGTISRPIYKTGRYAGKLWTSRDAGRLKKSIRVIRKKTKSGKAFSKKRDVRIYAGSYLTDYTYAVEYGGKAFLRPALIQSIPKIKSIIGVK